MLHGASEPVYDQVAELRGNLSRLPAKKATFFSTRRFRKLVKRSA
jgi:hypothetical protein